MKNRVIYIFVAACFEMLRINNFTSIRLTHKQLPFLGTNCNEAFIKTNRSEPVSSK